LSVQKAYRLQATGQVGALGAKKLIGFYVASTTAGTIVLRDGDSGGDVKSGTITPAAG
jgi:N-acyl-D-aspartate/D-glutamate deacylase